MVVKYGGGAMGDEDLATKIARAVGISGKDGNQPGHQTSGVFFGPSPTNPTAWVRLSGANQPAYCWIDSK